MQKSRAIRQPAPAGRLLTRAIVLACVLCLSRIVCRIAAAETATNAPPLSGGTPGWLPPIGESLVYRVYWGIIPIAKTRVVLRWQEEDGRRLIGVRYRARSNRMLAMIYPVNDSIEALIDPETLLPLRYTINLSEGRHRKHEVTTFDHAAGIASWKSLLSGKKQQIPIEADTRDLIAFLCYARQHHLAPKQEVQFRIMTDEKLYDLWLKAIEYEKISLPGFGSVRSLKIEPNAAFNGLFVRKGKMVVWVSNDERNVFTRIEATLPVANIRAVLSEVHGPPDDFWSQRTAELVRQGKIVRDDDEVEESLRELDTPGTGGGTK